MKSLKDYIFEAKNTVIELSSLEDENSKTIMPILEALIKKGFYVCKTETFGKKDNEDFLYYCLLFRGNDYILVIGGNDFSRINDGTDYTIYCSNRNIFKFNDEKNEKIVKMSKERNITRRTKVNHNEYQQHLIDVNKPELPKKEWYTITKFWTSSTEQKDKIYNVILTCFAYYVQKGDFKYAIKNIETYIS